MSMTAHRSAPCSTKSRVRLLRSRASPIVLAWPMDASPGGCSTPPPWHIDAVGGRPHHQGGDIAFETADCLQLGMALANVLGHVRLSASIRLQPADGDDVRRAISGSVADP